jgi:hypothetical protein
MNTKYSQPGTSGLQQSEADSTGQSSRPRFSFELNRKRPKRPCGPAARRARGRPRLKALRHVEPRQFGLGSSGDRARASGMPVGRTGVSRVSCEESLYVVEAITHIASAANIGWNAARSDHVDLARVKRNSARLAGVDANTGPGDTEPFGRSDQPTPSGEGAQGSGLTDNAPARSTLRSPDACRCLRSCKRR